MPFDDWQEFDSNDNRSDEARSFGLPVSFQGPTYFRFDHGTGDGSSYGVALFLDYGLDFRGAAACLAVADGHNKSQIWLSKAQLQEYAGIALDVADARSKAHLTISEAGSSNELAKLGVPLAMPADQLKRLVGALLDASDAIDTYNRTGSFPARHAHL